MVQITVSLAQLTQVLGVVELEMSMLHQVQSTVEAVDQD
jgi:hypothetical protein